MKRTVLIMVVGGLLAFGFAACEPIENGDFESPMDPPAEQPMPQ